MSKTATLSLRQLIHCRGKLAQEQAEHGDVSGIGTWKHDAEQETGINGTHNEMIRKLDRLIRDRKRRSQSRRPSFVTVAA
jgi:hypothetical protein|tara:strand:+ start:1323 stop:1562 length:240 start_codon:yes stop_codon:yes gene_type:complete